MIKITGKIEKVFPKQTLSGGFEKRVFWLDDQAENFPNTYQFELWKSDVEMIDKYKEGDVVTCFVDLKGKKFTGKDGEERITNTIKCWNIEKDGETYKKI